MKHKLLNQSLIAFIATGSIALANISARATELAGNVQGAGQPIAGSTVTLYAASTGAPTLDDGREIVASHEQSLVFRKWRGL
jgi:hypothetical protein